MIPRTPRTTHSVITGGVLLPLSALPAMAVYWGLAPTPVALLSAVCGAATLLWLLRRHAPSIVVVYLVVTLVGTIAAQQAPKLRADALDLVSGGNLAAQWRAAGRFDETLPIVVHLVFDEMMSPGAVDPSVPGGTATRSALYEFGARHGLRTYDSVYSRFFFSGVSLPNLMNREYLGQQRRGDVFTEQQISYYVNPYFEDLASRGYRTAVFQTSLMNFCANHQVDLCDTFDSFDPAGAASADLRNATVDLWRTLLRAYEPSYLSEYGTRLLRAVYGIEDRELGIIGVADRYDVQQFPRLFDRFTTFVTGVPRGSHVFAHFMVPHAPYLLTEDCVVSGRFDAGYYLATRFSAAEQDAKRREYFELYFTQLRCVVAKLDALLTAVGGVAAFSDAVIVIHGDHGSRISRGSLAKEQQPDDMIANYATYFAIRRPALEPGVDCEFVPLSQIFRRHLRGPGVVPAASEPLPVIVDSQAADGKSAVEMPMPRFGCAATARTP
jgi:hypothetical protein